MSFHWNYGFQRQQQHPPSHLFSSQTTGEQDDLAMIELSIQHEMHTHLEEESFLGSHVFDSPETTEKKANTSVVAPVASLRALAAASSGTASNPIDIDDTEQVLLSSNGTINSKKPSVGDASSTATTNCKKPSFRPVKIAKSKSVKAKPKEALKTNTTSDKSVFEKTHSERIKKGKTKGDWLKNANPQFAQTHAMPPAQKRKEWRGTKRKEKHGNASNDYPFVDPVASHAAAVRPPKQSVRQHDHDYPFEHGYAQPKSHGSHQRDPFLEDGIYADLSDNYPHGNRAQHHVDDNPFGGSKGKKRKLSTQHDMGSVPDLCTPMETSAAATNPYFSNQHKIPRQNEMVHLEAGAFSTNQRLARQRHQYPKMSTPPPPPSHNHRQGPNNRGLDGKNRNDSRSRPPHGAMFHSNGNGKNHHRANTLTQHHQQQQPQLPPNSLHRLQCDELNGDGTKHLEAIRNQMEAEAKKETEREKELRISAETRAKAAEQRAEDASKELETLQLELLTLKTDFGARIKTMEVENLRLEGAKMNAEAQTTVMAAQAEEKGKEIERLVLQVKGLTTEIEAVKKAQERMRIRLQKDVERKVAIEAKALADVTKALRKEQDARAEALKVALAKTEEARQKAEEVTALKNEVENVKKGAESMKTAALNGLLQMQDDSKRKAEADAQRIMQLANALRQEQEATLAAAAENISKSAEAERSAKQVARLQSEIERLKAEAMKAGMNEKASCHEKGPAQSASIDGAYLNDFSCLGGVSPSSNENESGMKKVPENRSSEGSCGKHQVPATSTRPSFRPKKVKRNERGYKNLQESNESPTNCNDNAHSSTERRFIFSNAQPKTDNMSSANVASSMPQHQAPYKAGPTFSKQSGDKKPNFQGWECTDEALWEQERLLNASKARMRTQQARQARVMPGNDKSTATSIPNKAFASLIHDVYIKFPDHWQYKNLYSRLGLPGSASDAMIKSQYRKLALQYHPDRNQHSEESKIKFQAVTEAYESLMHKH